MRPCQKRLRELTQQEKDDFRALLASNIGETKKKLEMFGVDTENLTQEEIINQCYNKFLENRSSMIVCIKLSNLFDEEHCISPYICEECQEGIFWENIGKRHIKSMAENPDVDLQTIVRNAKRDFGQEEAENLVLHAAKKGIDPEKLRQISEQELGK